MSIKPKVDKAIGEFYASTSSITQLLDIEPDPLASEKPPYPYAATRGWAYVWLSAAVEVFWTTYLESLCKGLSEVSSKSQRRHLKAQTVFFYQQLQTLSQGESEQKWRKSAALFESLVKDKRTLMTAVAPYDGRTVRPSHIELVWEIFELEHSAFTSPRHRTALETLAEKRNEVAHGRFSPITIGRLTTRKDLLSLLKTIGEIVDRCGIAAQKFY